MNDKTIDDRIIDDLVNGDLRGEEYRQALLAIDARPHLWRKCALAFLREQALRQDMQALVRGNVDWTQASDESHVDHADSVVLKQPPKNGWTQQELVQRLATLAALLLVSFSVGWLGAGLRFENQSQNGTSIQADMFGAAAPVTSSTTTGGGSLGSSSGRSDTSATPALWNASLGSGSQAATVLMGDQLTPLDMEVPLELRQLEELGYIRIEAFDALMLDTMPDGTSAIVPVRQLRITPELYSY